MPHGEAAAPEASELQVGDVVYRQGELASVVVVDSTLEPPSYVVRMAQTGQEVSCERHNLVVPGSLGMVSQSAESSNTQLQMPDNQYTNMGYDPCVRQPYEEEIPKNHALQALTEALDRAEVDMLMGARSRPRADELSMEFGLAGVLGEDFSFQDAIRRREPDSEFTNFALRAASEALGALEEPRRRDRTSPKNHRATKDSDLDLSLAAALGLKKSDCIVPSSSSSSMARAPPAASLRRPPRLAEVHHFPTEAFSTPPPESFEVPRRQSTGKRALQGLGNAVLLLDDDDDDDDELEQMALQEMEEEETASHVDGTSNPSHQPAARRQHPDSSIAISAAAVLATTPPSTAPQTVVPSKRPLSERVTVPPHLKTPSPTLAPWTLQQTPALSEIMEACPSFRTPSPNLAQEVKSFSSSRPSSRAPPAVIVEDVVQHLQDRTRLDRRNNLLDCILNNNVSRRPSAKRAARSTSRGARAAGPRYEDYVAKKTAPSRLKMPEGSKANLRPLNIEERFAVPALPQLTPRSGEVGRPINKETSQKTLMSVSGSQSARAWRSKVGTNLLF